MVSILLIGLMGEVCEDYDVRIAKQEGGLKSLNKPLHADEGDLLLS